MLRERAEDYPELTVPMGGLLVTAGCDVQHDRIAVVIRAWGRGEESWLLYWGEIHGSTMIEGQGAWVDLAALLDKGIPHVNGTMMKIRAVTVDSSDGQTSDAVYNFVRKRMAQGYMAGKGASLDDGREIFATPKAAVDLDRKQKSHRYGLRPFIVGTQRAKDLILGHDAGAGRLRLTGSGPGRMHWYKGVRPDYYEQITSEVKAPHRNIPKKLVWQKKAGVRNEALDCEVYALHAARSLKTNLYQERHWQELEAQINQQTLFDEAQAAQVVQAAQEAERVEEKPMKPEKAAPAPNYFANQNSGWTAARW
jgi:phage terminase large subunit GpA-like protein